MKCVLCCGTPNLCTQCYQNALESKYNQQTYNQLKLQNIKTQILKFETEFQFKKQTSQLTWKHQIQKEKDLVQKIIKKKSQIIKQKQRLSIYQQLIKCKRKNVLQNLKHIQYMNQVNNKLSTHINQIRKTYKQQIKKNNSLKAIKTKDIMNALISQFDQSIIMKQLQIGETGQITIKDLYGEDDIFEAIKSQTIIMKNIPILNQKVWDVVKNNCLALMNLQKIHDFWVPFNPTKIIKQIKSQNQQTVIKNLGFLQANIEYLSHKVGIQDRPLLCMNKFLIKGLVQQNKLKFKPIWISNLIYLKVDYVQLENQVQQQCQSSYLPPIALLQSPSQSEVDQFQILQ